ncbi:MAG TPA: histidinol dehydrogenase, partial [Candidatus Thermoplasmatota archaeon]|nr:histidinol dehydrogenase [Candidatus Thermoplasmatota archaeon]
AQAEHDPLAAVALVTWDAALMDEVRRLVPEFVAACPRKDIIAEALRRRGALLLAPDRATALAFADRYAPEHLVLATASADKDLEAVRSYGSAFLGPWSAVTLGDYCSGTNHVLPTGGLARAGSGLAVDDFLRRSTHQRATREGLVALAPVAIALAETEGLPAHAEAVRVRLSARGPR